jgi:hypothetical protein
MIKAVEFKGKDFENKAELFKALKTNKKELVGLKTAQVKNSDSIRSTMNKVEATKAITGLEDGFIYPVINTTKYMDSHNDVHMDGIWNKSLTDQVGKVHYLINHELEVGKVIAYPKDVETFTKDVLWSDLGVDFAGTTEALMFKTRVFDYSNADAKKIIQEKIDIEHSIRMQYVKIDLAIDSTDEDMQQEKAVWDMYINDIANKEAAIEQGYFWAVTEAKIYKEGSMVLAGSNDVTPMVYPTKDNEPDASTQNNEPSNDTQTKQDLKEKAKKETLLRLIKQQ